MSPTWLHWPASGAWSPSDLTGLQCWLDAADSSTITLSGSNVAEWADKTANGYDATDAVNSSNATVTTKRPTVAAAAQNGLDALAFNGSQYLDHNSSRSMLQDRSCAVFAAACKYGSVSNSTFQFVWSHSEGLNSAAPAVRMRLFHNSTNAFSVVSRRLDSDQTNEIVSGSNNPPLNTDWHVHLVVCDFAANALEYRVDGASLGTDAYPSGGANTSNTDLGTAAATWTAIGSNSRIDNALYPLSSGSRIGELICHAISSGSYATNDVEKIEGYLAHKWGLESNLPSTHPYKSSAP